MSKTFLFILDCNFKVKLLLEMNKHVLSKQFLLLFMWFWFRKEKKTRRCSCSNIKKCYWPTVWQNFREFKILIKIITSVGENKSLIVKYNFCVDTTNLRTKLGFWSLFFRVSKISYVNKLIFPSPILRLRAFCVLATQCNAMPKYYQLLHHVIYNIYVS